MPAVVSYVMPVLQLTCHLVCTGNSSISNMTPAEILGALQNSEQTLPPGYVAHPEYKVAYKVHTENVTWETAKEECAREGAYLATLDTAAKIQAVRNQHQSALFMHVGYYMKAGDDSNWYNVHTGLTSSSLPWGSGEPNGSYRCAVIKLPELGLGNYDCSSLRPYVCQISYS